MSEEEAMRIKDAVNTYLASIGLINEKEYLKSLKRINEIKARMLELTTHLGADADFDAIQKEFRELEAEKNKLYEGLDISRMPLSNPEKLFEKWQTYYDMMYRTQKQYAEKVKDLKLDEINAEEQNAIFDENENYDKTYKDIEEKYNQHLQEMQDLHTQEVDDALEHLNQMEARIPIIISRG